MMKGRNERIMVLPSYSKDLEEIHFFLNIKTVF